MGWPPIATTAPSVLTLVLVLRFENMTAIVLFARAWELCFGADPDLIAALCSKALRTRAVNSFGVRSAIDSRWRGAKGDTVG